MYSEMWPGIFQSAWRSRSFISNEYIQITLVEIKLVGKLDVICVGHCGKTIEC